MKVLTNDEQEQVCEALRLSSIYLQEHPDNDSPIRKVGKALDLMCSPRESDSRVQDLETTLRVVLAAVKDSEGALLRPSQEVVDMMSKAIQPDSQADQG